jgi:hypothetical protein
VVVAPEDSIQAVIWALPGRDVARGEAKVGVLRVMTSAGDKMAKWGTALADADEMEAGAAVKEAERIFKEARAKGGTAFRVVPGQPAERLEQFDPDAEVIVVVPRVAGGGPELSHGPGR